MTAKIAALISEVYEQGLNDAWQLTSQRHNAECSDTCSKGGHVSDLCTFRCANPRYRNPFTSQETTVPEQPMLFDLEH